MTKKQQAALNNPAADQAIETTHNPVNAITGKEYQNTNKEKLTEAARAKGYASPEWATLKQWNATNRSIAKGEKGTQITFFEASEAKDGQIVKIATRAFVFNRSQLASLKQVSPQD